MLETLPSGTALFESTKQNKNKNKKQQYGLPAEKQRFFRRWLPKTTL